MLDGDIVITVLGIERNGAVRLGIDAPDHVRILRKELVDEVAAENRGARTVQQPDTALFNRVQAMLQRREPGGEES